MHHAVPTRGRSSASRRYRPRVLELEARLPLGDTALGVLAAVLPDSSGGSLDRSGTFVHTVTT